MRAFTPPAVAARQRVAGAEQKLPFFPEVHEELVRTWRAPHSSRPRLSSSPLTSLDGGAARGYEAVPQACKLSSALAGRAYHAAGHAATALHAMATLQVYQAKVLKHLHEKGSDQGAMEELRAATDFALRATKVTARSLGQVMSTIVVQERHLWLTLAQMADVDKSRFLDAPISQSGLFGDTVEDFAQQFSAVQKQTEAIKHILPRRRPPAAAKKQPAPSPAEVHDARLAARRRAARGRRAPPASQPGGGENRSLGGDKINVPTPGGGPGAAVCSDAAVGLRVGGTHKVTERANFLTSGVQAPSSLFEQRPRSVSSDSEPDVASAGTREEGCPTAVTSVNVPLIPLATRLGAWLQLPSPSRWLIRTVRLGYAIQFARRPPRYRGVLSTSVHSDTHAAVLRAEVAVLLAKDAIEPVSPAEMKSGFYSPYFIVPKKSGGLRPILDLRALNRSLLRLPFKMLTMKRMLTCIRPQDWFAVIDLKDAYFHVSILPRHRPFLRFAFEGRAYQYKVLPFGLSLSPRVFTKVAEAALSPLWQTGISRRLASHSSLARSVVRTEGHGAPAPQPSGPSGRPREEQTLPSAEDLFSRRGDGLGQYDSPPHQRPRLQWHINCLELLAVLLALRRFRPTLRHKHVLVHTDSTATVAYINRQGGLRSRRMSQLARHLLLWSQTWLKSLRAVHIPGEFNRAADQLSRQSTHPGEWRLHPETVQLIWSHFGEAQIDLFASPKSSHCQRFYSLNEAPNSLGRDALAHSWPPGPKYAFPPVSLLAQTLCKIREDEEQVLLVAPYWPTRTWFPELISLAAAPPWKIPLRRDLLSQGMGTIWHPRPDLWNLHVWFLDGTRQNSPAFHRPAPSTRQAYALRWGLFVDWCSSRGEDPQRCTIAVVLSFLQEKLERRLSLSTLKVYVAAIAAYHDAVDGTSLGRTPYPLGTSPSPSKGLREAPFEPLASVELKYLSLKTALLTALASIKRVGDLQAFSVDEACLEFGPGDSHVILRPRPGYVPKVPTTPFRDQVVNLQALPLEEADPASALLCPVRALRIYVDRTRHFRRTEQLFVCFGGQQKGNAVSKQRLAHWVVDAISLSYQNQGEPCPLGVRAHSTRSVASSYALAHGASLADICRAAGWATPNTFARFYNLRVEAVSSRVRLVSACCAIPNGSVRYFPQLFPTYVT
ncbi:hypothetical protein H4Q32_021090 [Labeo rohita]|uniref:ribonuclease H n=1 Tax=Labeo rohita TaxID=84645 RepID=A0ABQ8M399_LABRO|nr:hypothetical protein H4Q32_021090 [Labeo rohita]